MQEAGLVEQRAHLLGVRTRGASPMRRQCPKPRACLAKPDGASQGLGQALGKRSEGLGASRAALPVAQGLTRPIVYRGASLPPRWPV